MSEQYTGSKLKIFALNSNKPLAEKLLNQLAFRWGRRPLTVLAMEKFASTLKNQFVVTKFSLSINIGSGK